MKKQTYLFTLLITAFMSLSLFSLPLFAKKHSVKENTIHNTSKEISKEPSKDTSKDISNKENTAKENTVKENNINSNQTQSQLSDDPKIKAFLEHEQKNISAQFPYRINLYKQGNIDQNQAGIRIAENAKQFDDLGLSGLLFYYKLYDHSMRVPHWHANAVEVGVVLNGKMKITIWEGEGKAKIFTVEKNGTWMIPQASLHALENVGDTELEFIVAYNSSQAADRDFATAWAALPSSILEKSLGLNTQDIETLKHTTNNRLSLYDPASLPEKTDINSTLSSNFSSVAALYNGELGSLQRIDAKTTPEMKYMALQKTILKPGSMREPHWYIAGDTMLYVRKGQAFYTMMDDEGKVFNALLVPGDLVFIPKGTFHAYVNVSNEALEVYETFNASENLSEVTLLNGTKQFSAGTIASATGLKKEVVNDIMNRPTQNYIMPF